MKKIIGLISCLTLASGLMLSISACFNPLTEEDGGEVKPPIPPVEDIAYYTKLINAKAAEIADCQEWIKDIYEEWNKGENPEIPDQEYQLAIDAVSAEQYSYQSLINEYQYQILLLEKQGEKFTPDQVLLGIVIFTESISNLEQELNLKESINERMKDEYSEKELEKIRSDINVSKALLAFFENLKEEEKN